MTSGGSGSGVSGGDGGLYAQFCGVIGEGACE